MKCKQCGKDLTDSAKFCTNCGMEVVQDRDEILLENEENVKIGAADSSEGSSSNVDMKTSKIANLKEKWNDKYTIFAIIGVMIIAALGGFIFKNVRSQSEELNENNYAYDESYSSDEEEYEKIENEEAFSQEDMFYDEESEENELEEESESQEAHEYILPDSSTSYLAKSDLMGLSAEECRLARNEIYARHGRIFKDESLQEYFENFDWYYPTIQPDDFEESMLNDYEIANRDLIVEYETEQGYR